MIYKIGVVGLGYVGLPVAVALAKRYQVCGFDINNRRIEALIDNKDATGMFTKEELMDAKVVYTNEPKGLSDCQFIIITVPTPVDDARNPDLSPLIQASETVGYYLKRGTIVVYESTVYPGATEEICIPLLEKSSGLKAGEDFFVGYSPERINPGDREHTFERILKVVSAQDDRTLEIVANVYGSVVTAGVFKASCIRVAEAAKIIENTQRDLNIALMNELAIIFERMKIPTYEVIEAAATKWNFLRFTPGLVGGHCIGVDPYYLTYKAERIGYHPEVILAGRKINDGMGRFIANSLVKRLVQRGQTLVGATITVIGITFKENVPDIRNTKVIDLIDELKQYGLHVQVMDPLAEAIEVQREYGIDLSSETELQPAELVILAVPHDEIMKKGINWIRNLLKEGNGIIADIKNALPNVKEIEGADIWRL